MRDNTWQTSSFCSADKPQCVEVFVDRHGGASVRDSKNPDKEPLEFNADEWSAFVAGVKAGEFDQAVPATV